MNSLRIWLGALHHVRAAPRRLDQSPDLCHAAIDVSAKEDSHVWTRVVCPGCGLYWSGRGSESATRDRKEALRTIRSTQPTAGRQIHVLALMGR